MTSVSLFNNGISIQHGILSQRMTNTSKNYFFIDDSGSRIWEDSYIQEIANTPPDKNDSNVTYWRKNYFVFAGVHVSGDTLGELNVLINKGKNEYFGTKDIEIKSDWLRRDDKRKKHYPDMSEKKLRDFVEDFWYGLFTPDNFTIQAFVLDKRVFSERDKSPTALLTQLMFNTIRNHPNTITNIIFDQMEENTGSRRSDQRVIDEVALSSGIFESHPSVQPVQFENSSGSNFLQIADTVAYNVFRDFYKGGSEKGEVYPYLEKILPCFYKKSGENGIYIAQP